MAKTDGYSQYVCDRYGKTEHLASNSPSRSDWRELKRVDSSGVETGALICRDCNAKYKDIVSAQDAEYRIFMANQNEEK